MPRKPLGDQPLTQAERLALRRRRKAEAIQKMRTALIEISTAKTIQEATEIALLALKDKRA